MPLIHHCKVEGAMFQYWGSRAKSMKNPAPGCNQPLRPGRTASRAAPRPRLHRLRMEEEQVPDFVINPYSILVLLW